LSALGGRLRSKDRKGNVYREETAFKVAWAAVKNEYHKDNTGNWKNDSD